MLTKRGVPETLRAQNDFEKCRVCGREIVMAGRVNRDTWPYQYKRKRNGKVETVFACNREHYYVGKAKDV